MNWPSKLVAPPYAVIGMRYFREMFTTATTSAVDAGKTTIDGALPEKRLYRYIHGMTSLTELPLDPSTHRLWAVNTSGSVETASWGSAALIAWTALAKSCGEPYSLFSCTAVPA